MAYLDTSGQDATSKSKPIEQLRKYQYKAKQTQHLIPPNKNLGEITSTGLIINNIEYSLLIQTIDETSLLAMPQKKVDESSHHFIPNQLIESSKPLDSNDPQTEALLKNLKSKDFNINNDWTQ